MRILAIDLGTKTGWAARLRDGSIKSGVVNFDYDKRIEGGGIRYLRFAEWLKDVTNETECDCIVFEEVRAHSATHAAHVFGGLLANLQSYCDSKPEVPYTSFPVKTIKKFIAGKGNASKEEVMNAVKKLGFTPLDDNEADAIAILLCAESSMCPNLGDLQYEW